MCELSVLYHDNRITAVIKPVGIDSEKDMPALLHDNLGGEYFCVHRLDKAVGGVMVYAGNSKAAAWLSGLVSSKEQFKKEYYAVVPDTEHLAEGGTLKDLLYHDSRNNKTYIVDKERKGVKSAELDYRVIARNGELALLKISLKTGRSHQIRVQLASRKLPLVGDKKYGSRIPAKNIALWSAGICFPSVDGKAEFSFTAVPENVFPWTEFNSIFN